MGGHGAAWTGYSAIARARHRAIRWSATSADSPSGRPIARTRLNFVISVSQGLQAELARVGLQLGVQRRPATRIVGAHIVGVHIVGAGDDGVRMVGADDDGVQGGEHRRAPTATRS